MTRRSPHAPPPRFPWRKALRNAGVKGVEEAVIHGGVTALHFPEPNIVALAAAITFAGGFVFSFGGEVINHRADDPLFDARTTFLFDTTGVVAAYLLFVMPALALDQSLHPAIPGAYSYAALFLSAFLITVLRGLFCNMGWAREPEERELMQG
jgi:hypothetical protein